MWPFHGGSRLTPLPLALETRVGGDFGFQARNVQLWVPAASSCCGCFEFGRLCSSLSPLLASGSLVAFFFSPSWLPREEAPKVVWPLLFFCSRTQALSLLLSVSLFFAVCKLSSGLKAATAAGKTCLCPPSPPPLPCSPVTNQAPPVPTRPSCHVGPRCPQGPRCPCHVAPLFQRCLSPSSGAQPLPHPSLVRSPRDHEWRKEEK